ncbi:hypothetical protein KAR91_40060 [Candidatus Pacearchaeota archaeon]|nr:hypothetical protein [Candidatus Pacearchaeota archaeon]
MKLSYLFIGLLVFLNLASYYLEDYLTHASIFFNGFYFLTLIASVIILSQIKLKLLITFSVIVVILGFCVEYLNTTAHNWSYFNSGQLPLFAVIGWIFLLALIFYVSGFLKNFVKWRVHSMIPSLVCFGLFLVFTYLAGYITPLTGILYVFMTIVGVYSSVSTGFGWNFSVLLIGVLVGSVSEVLGASCDLWSFQSGSLLPLPMVLAWSANAFTVSGLMKLLGFQVEKIFTIDSKN